MEKPKVVLSSRAVSLINYLAKHMGIESQDAVDMFTLPDSETGGIPEVDINKVATFVLCIVTQHANKDQFPSLTIPANGIDRDGLITIDATPYSLDEDHKDAVYIPIPLIDMLCNELSSYLDQDKYKSAHVLFGHLWQMGVENASMEEVEIND